MKAFVVLGAVATLCVNPALARVLERSDGPSTCMPSGTPSSLPCQPSGTPCLYSGQPSETPCTVTVTPSGIPSTTPTGAPSSFSVPSSGAACPFPSTDVPSASLTEAPLPSEHPDPSNTASSSPPIWPSNGPSFTKPAAYPEPTEPPVQPSDEPSSTTPSSTPSTAPTVVPWPSGACGPTGSFTRSPSSSVPAPSASCIPRRPPYLGPHGAAPAWRYGPEIPPDEACELVYPRYFSRKWRA